MSLESNLEADAGFLDPTSQDHFESVDDQVCPEILTVTVNFPGSVDFEHMRFQCEIEGKHAEHEAEVTLRWTTNAENKEESEDGDGD